MLADIISWALIIAIPGPDIIAIGSQVARHGTRTGLTTAMGATVGVAVWSVLSLVGITAVMATMPTLQFILPVAGASVLVLLGLMALWSAAHATASPATAEKVTDSVSYESMAGHTWNSAKNTREVSQWASFRLGLITNLSNPKALIFFSSFFTPMMNHYQSFQSKTVMLLILLAVAGLIFCIMSYLMEWLSSTRVATHAATKFIPGLVFVAIGVYYLVETLSASV